MVNGINDAVSVAAGHAHTCAIVSGGAVKCWGDNGSQQIGEYILKKRIHTEPIIVAGISGAIGIATGHSHSCALVGAGSIQCWGYNLGALGNDSNTDASSPVTVANISGVTHLSSGGYHACAEGKQFGPLCWGLNPNGQLGTKNNQNSLVPVPINLQ